MVAADHSAADAPEATVVDDLDAALRAQLTAALTPLHAALRATPDPLLRVGPRAIWAVAGDAIGRRHVVRPRGSCCFYYRLPNVAPCLTCPRLTRAQLLDRLVEQPDPT